jgi:putative oxidoreductase
MSALTIVTVAGRALIALLFILAGIAKAIGPQPVLEQMAAFGVPGFLLPAVIALEIGGGLALLIGWRLREAAGALALFCIVAAVIFHHEFGKPAERTLFLKDLAIAGGLLAIAAGAEAARRARAASRA